MPPVGAVNAAVRGKIKVANAVFDDLALRSRHFDELPAQRNKSVFLVFVLLVAFKLFIRVDHVSVDVDLARVALLPFGGVDAVRRFGRERLAREHDNEHLHEHDDRL